VRTVDQGRAFEMCRKLAREEGLLDGGSTGLNVCGARELAGQVGLGKRAVTFACDNRANYLGGPIYS